MEPCRNLYVNFYPLQLEIVSRGNEKNSVWTWCGSKNDERVFRFVISSEKHTCVVSSEFNIHSSRVWGKDGPIQYLQQGHACPKVTLLCALGSRDGHDIHFVKIQVSCVQMFAETSVAANRWRGRKDNLFHKMACSSLYVAGDRLSK
jgi:hypothetical protein